MRTVSLHRKADGQLGLLTTGQLRALGFSDSAISRLVRSGIIIRVHRAVFRVPGSTQNLQQRALAACLACDGVASGVTAASLWRLIERPVDQVHVTVLRGRWPTHDGFSIHRANSLPSSDVTHLGPIPITRVTRTIRDLPRLLQEEALDEAIRQRRVAPHDFVDDGRFLGGLAKDRLGLGVPHEKIERKAVALFKKLGLPAPVRQFRVGRYRLDLAYPDRKIAIELLGEVAHWGRVRFQHDIDRRNALELAGWRQIDLSWFDVTRDEAKVRRTMSALLADEVFDRFE